MSNMIEISDYIKRSNYFIVTSHISPDGDNIGSTLSMYHALKSMNKDVEYVIDDDIPTNLKFLTKDISIKKSEDVNLEYYNIIALDCGDKNRICISEDIMKNKDKLICIDHHASNDYYGDLNYVDIDASSTCELVYNLLKYMSKDNDKLISEDISTCLYTGLVTDTGNFTHSNALPSSFLMAKELIELGARRDQIIQNIFQSNTFDYYKLLGEALNTLKVNNNIASITLTKDMMDRNNMNFNEVDGITPYTRDIKDVEVGILFKEKENNVVKVSLRSKNYVNVSEIAKKFGGGGHVRASGCTLNMDIEDAREMVVKEVLKHI